MTDIDRENDVFSNDTTCDFQTAHMINKIKNVKPNAKKRKKLLNIQNIEPLININETPEEPVKEEPIIEPMEPIIAEDDWTGVEDIYEGGGDNENSKGSFADVIEQFFNMLSELYDRFAFFITKTFSIDDFFKDDVKYIKKYISWFVSIIVASFGLYNWIFVMFYKNKSDKRPDIWKVPRDKIKKRSEEEPFFRLINMITYIPFFFPHYLEQTIVKWIPEQILCILKKNGETYQSAMLILYMLLLVALTVITYHSYTWIKVTIISLARYKFEGVLSMVIYPSALILYIMSLMEKYPNIMDYFIILTAIGWVIEKVVVLLILLFIGVPMAILMCLVYLITFTLFGIMLFKEKSTMMEIKVHMDDFFNAYKPKEREDTDCTPLGFFDKLVNYIIIIFNKMYDNCIQLGVILMMLSAIIDSSMNLKSNALKLVILAITCTIIALVAMFSFVGKPDKTAVYNENRDTIKTPINPDYVKYKTKEFTDMLNPE